MWLWNRETSTQHTLLYQTIISKVNIQVIFSVYWAHSSVNCRICLQPEESPSWAYKKDEVSISASLEPTSILYMQSIGGTCRSEVMKWFLIQVIINHTIPTGNICELLFLLFSIFQVFLVMAERSSGRLQRQMISSVRPVWGSWTPHGNECLIHELRAGKPRWWYRKIKTTVTNEGNFSPVSTGLLSAERHPSRAGRYRDK